MVARSIVKEEIELIQTEVKQWIESPSIDVVISTGGTGLTGRDVTPEAFKEIFEKEIEGFGELFRWLSFKKIGDPIASSPIISDGSLYVFTENSRILGFN